ncbi:MAG: VWA domain-containing protein [Ruminococcaceae bacterium]|nr:VWA domain-containing protein [Oscillospiraceae bacterium]
MKKDITEVVFILDKSGSMGGLEKDTIGGYNSMLNEQKALEGECNITTLLFDHEFELLHDRIDVKEVKPLTDKDYRVGGCTALLDAMGKAIKRVSKHQKKADDSSKADKVIFIIITDGEENSSRKYSVEKIRSMVEKKKSELGWEFIFLGANIDAIQTAANYGISADRAQDFHADKKGVKLSFHVMSGAISELRKGSGLSDNWKKEIKSDFESRDVKS